MLKKFILATGVASLALAAPLAAKKPDSADAAVDAAKAAAEAAKEAAGDADETTAEPVPDYPYAASSNPFAELEKFALKKPLIELPVPDPARLKIANQLMTKLYFDGVSKHVMQSARKDLLQPLLDRVWNMKASEIAALFGVDEVPEGKNDKTFAQNFAKDDPYGKQRFEAYINTYIDLIGEMSAPVESDIRGAMARDFARRYDLAQLTEMSRFFATPAGAAFAQDYMTSNFSLDVLQTSMMVWPKMAKAVPDFAERLAKADAHLPPKPKAKSSTYDIQELPTCAADDDDSDCSADDKTLAEATRAANAAAAEAMMTDLESTETGEEPWHDSANWSPAEQKKTDALYKVYDKASDKSSKAYDAYTSAQEAAIDAARQRYKAEGWKPEVVPETSTDAADAVADAPHDHED